MKDDHLAGSPYQSYRCEELNRHPVLNSIRTNRILRIVIVAVTFMGWFVLSNHCALGRMMRSAPLEKAPSCCHRDAPKPVKEPANGDQCAHCCKSLHAVMPGVAKAIESTAPMFVIAILPSPVALEAQTGQAVLIASDSGPPRAASFSELVLHRSLRSHAPPFPA